MATKRSGPRAPRLCELEDDLKRQQARAERAAGKREIEEQLVDDADLLAGLDLFLVDLPRLPIARCRSK